MSQFGRPGFGRRNSDNRNAVATCAWPNGPRRGVRPDDCAYKINLWQGIA